MSWYFTLHYNSLKANNALCTDYINNIVSSYFSDYVVQSNEMSAYLNQLKKQTNKQKNIKNTHSNKQKGLDI